MTYSKLYFSGGTDIQRLLHNIKPTTSRPRRSGRTYSTLLYMVGQVFYGKSDSAYLYLGENRMMCDTIRFEFLEILERKGINAFRSTNIKVNSTNQMFIFSTIENWAADVKGYNLEMAFNDVYFNPNHTAHLNYLSAVCKNIHRG